MTAKLYLTSENYSMYETSPGRFSIYLNNGPNIRANMSLQEAIVVWNHISRIDPDSINSGSEEFFPSFDKRFVSGTGTESERGRIMREIKLLINSPVKERGWD